MVVWHSGRSTVVVPHTRKILALVTFKEIRGCVVLKEIRSNRNSLYLYSSQSNPRLFNIQGQPTVVQNAEKKYLKEIKDIIFVWFCLKSIAVSYNAENSELSSLHKQYRTKKTPLRSHLVVAV
jgi:hypothetical protein